MLPPSVLVDRASRGCRLLQTADADTARVAGTNVDTLRRTPSVWAGVEPAKLNTGVGYPYLGTGAAGIPQTAYLGQPIPLRPAAPMQLASSQFHQPWVYGPGAGSAPAPHWNYPVESWVRAPQGQLVGIPPSAPVQQGWGAGCTPEARGTQPPVSQPEVERTSQTTASTESRPR